MAGIVSATLCSAAANMSFASTLACLDLSISWAVASEIRMTSWTHSSNVVFEIITVSSVSLFNVHFLFSSMVICFSFIHGPETGTAMSRPLLTNPDLRVLKVAKHLEPACSYAVHKCFTEAFDLKVGGDKRYLCAVSYTHLTLPTTPYA